MNENALQQARNTAVDLGVKFGPKVVVALLILVAGYFVSRWAGRLVVKLFERLELEPPLRQLLGRVIRLLVIGLFALMALQNLGVELLPLLAGLGLAGAGIALATQGVLSNVAAGLTIIFTKPYRVGEYIMIAGEEGQVKDISLFSTVLGHPDLSRVVIPNRKIAGEILRNYGRIRQLDLSVGVAYRAALDQALGAVQQVLAANPRVLREPAALVQIQALGDSSVQIAIKPWVNVPDYLAASGEIYRAVLQAFRDQDIVIPAPQREVRLLEGRG